MSYDINIRRAVEKNEKIDERMEQVIQLRTKALAAAIARSLNLSDPDVTAWLSTRLAELALVLQHAPASFSGRVVLTLLDILPDDVGAEIVKYYVDRIDRAYKTISQLASKVAPKTFGMNNRDPMTSIIYMLAEQYIAQQLGGTQQTQVHEPVSPSPIPDELKRVIDQLNEESSGRSNETGSNGTSKQLNATEGKGPDS